MITLDIFSVVFGKLNQPDSLSDYEKVTWLVKLFPAEFLKVKVTNCLKIVNFGIW